MMNSVHEPGPNGDSKISPSRKTVRKAKPDAQAPSRPSRHAQVRTGTPRRAHAQARARPAVSWAGLAVSCPRPPVVSQPQPLCGSASRALLCALPRTCRRRHGRIVGASRPCRRRSCRVVALCARVSPPSSQRPCALRAQPTQLPSNNTMFCIAAKNQPNQAPQSRYKFCIVTLPVQPTACLSPSQLAI